METAAIDKTIESLCKWVQDEIEKQSDDFSILPQMTKALAKLVEARAQLVAFDLNVK